MSGWLGCGYNTRHAHGFDVGAACGIMNSCLIAAKDECPSGLRSTPRKRVRATPSASSNLASSAPRVFGSCQKPFLFSGLPCRSSAYMTGLSGIAHVILVNTGRSMCHGSITTHPHTHMWICGMIHPPVHNPPGMCTGATSHPPAHTAG